MYVGRRYVINTTPISKKTGFYKFGQMRETTNGKITSLNMGDLVRDVCTAQPEAELSQKLWTRLNRIRADQGHRNYLVNKCRQLRDNPECDC